MSTYADKKSKLSEADGNNHDSYFYNSNMNIDEPLWLRVERMEKAKKDLKLFKENPMQYLLENYKSHIHYNSSEPKKFGLKAFTKGGEIHLSSGAEDSIGHELGHVVQQKTKNIAATAKIGKEKVNLDPKLEKEADEIANHIENYVPEIVSEDINKTKDVVQFEYDPQNPGAWQEQRRDYYKDKSFVIDRVLNVQNDISLVDRCTSVEQINTMLKNILASYWGDNPKDHVVNLDTMDLDLAKANAKQLIYLFSKYSTSIYHISMDRTISGRALVTPDFNTGRILKFGEPYNADMETYSNGESIQMMFGQHVNLRDQANSDRVIPIYGVTHEFGHSLLSFEELKKWHSDEDGTNGHKICIQIRNLFKNYGKLAGDDSFFISKYAKSSVDEFIAECFAQAQLSSNPSSYANQVMKILDAYFAWEHDEEQLER